MKESVLASIIIPVYNVEKYLDYCMVSVINQEYENIEILLVDDGSTDSSGKMCDEWEKKDQRIRVIHKENGGLSDARNCGLLEARGEYVTFLDSDDYISKHFVSDVISEMKKADAQIGIGGMKTVHDYSNQIDSEERTFMTQDYSSSDAIKEMLYERGINTSACGKIFERQLLDEIAFPKGKYYEDLATVFLIMEKANCIISVKYDYYYYYQRVGSIVNSELCYCHLDIFEAWNKLYCQLVLRDKTYLKAFCSKKFDGLVGLLQKPEGRDLVNRKEIWREVKHIRKRVVFDRNAKPRIRLEALLSYFGQGVLLSVLRQYYSKR